MTDIVERLRAVDHMMVEDCFLQSHLFAQAADEIERLRAECQRLAGEVSRAHKAGRREGIEAAAAYCDVRQRVYEQRAIAALDRDGFDQHDISLASTLMASAFESAAAAIRALLEDGR